MESYELAWCGVCQPPTTNDDARHDAVRCGCECRHNGTKTTCRKTIAPSSRADAIVKDNASRWYSDSLLWTSSPPSIMSSQSHHIALHRNVSTPNNRRTRWRQPKSRQLPSGNAMASASTTPRDAPSRSAETRPLQFPPNECVASWTTPPSSSLEFGGRRGRCGSRMMMTMLMTAVVASKILPMVATPTTTPTTTATTTGTGTTHPNRNAATCSSPTPPSPRYSDTILSPTRSWCGPSIAGESIRTRTCTRSRNRPSLARTAWHPSDRPSIPWW
mmetsp:Transcript_19815/g.55960  ORF Transcript_19815/g.55960 Transcript_19815/m.55960 type:complete len:274 (-) Transcript_19815:728-1549(-)